MAKDFCECLRKAYTMSGKDCDTCSWGDLTIGDVGMCEMDEVRKAVGKWEVIPLEKEILMEYADVRVELKEMRKRIEEDQIELCKLENSVVTDSVSRGKKGKKSLGSVKITGKPEGLIKRKQQLLNKRIMLRELKEIELLEKQTQAEEYIQSIEKSEFRMMLMYFFIDDLSYVQTAEQMNKKYPKRQIRYTEENVRKRIQRFFQNVPQCPVSKC